MIKLDRLSLIIPTRGRPDSLKCLLDSVHRALGRQSGSLEIVIVDDHSFQPISAEYLGFPRAIKWVRTPRRVGPGAARNFGANMVRDSSQWLLFLDDDVLMEEDYFNILCAVEIKSDWVGIEGVTLVSSVQSPFEKNPSRVNFKGGFGSGNILYRKSVFLDENGFEEQFFHPSGIHFREDTDLGLRMLKHGKIYLCEELRVVHDRGENNLGFLLLDARKYYFEPLFLYRNPDAREWIGSPFRRGRLGTYQMRGLLSSLVVLVVGSLLISPSFFLSSLLIVMYLTLFFLLTRGFAIPLRKSPFLLPVLILYPWVHALYYWKGFLELVLPQCLRRAGQINKRPKSRLRQVLDTSFMGMNRASLPTQGLKILQVVRVFHPSEGGMENFVKNLSFHLLEYGHHVDILTLNKGHGSNDELSEHSTLEIMGQVINIFRVAASWYGPWFVPELSKIKLRDYDLIHIHGVDGFLEQLTGKKRNQFHAKVPIVLSTHGGFFHTTRWHLLKKIWFHTRIKEHLRHVNCVFACSIQDAKLFAKVHDAISVIENGVQIDDLFPVGMKKLDLNRLIFVGGFYEYKSIRDIVLFVEKMKIYNPAIHLELIGNGPLKGDVENLIHKRNLQNCIHLPGRVSRERLASAYQEAGIFISASRYEGFGLAIVEAMASGCLLLLNQIPAFEKFFKGTPGGELVPFTNLEDVISGYNRLCNLSLEARLEISNANQEYSKKYSWSAVSEEFERHYMAQLEEVTFPEPPGSL